MVIPSVCRALLRAIACIACLALLGLFVACEPTGTCADGQIVGCPCATGQGTQACSGGAWTACNCQPGCQENAQVACDCSGQAGAQVCSGGAWGPCNCVQGSCTDGQTLPCKCSDGKAGTQTCSGTNWGACSGCQGINPPPPPPPQDCTTPNATQACQCSDGKKGTQTCGANNKWTPCNCESTPPPDCATGQKQPCKCLDGRDGQRECGADQRWGACTCTGTTGPCNDGETRDCICSNRGNGKQQCLLQNGKYDWGPCVQCGDPSEKCTKPGETKVCTCPSGAGSRQTCGQDGKWGACACGSGPCTEGQVLKDDCDCPSGYRGDNVCKKGPNGALGYYCKCDCTPKETRECPCAGGQKGARTCKDDKTWSACACPTCKKDADCAKHSVAKFCDTTTERCVQCLKNDQCSGQICSPSTQQCVECASDADCASATAKTCYPLDNKCKSFGRGSLEGVVRRCSDSAGAGKCAGNQKRGDDKGKLYFLFYTGNNFPPTYREKPFFVYNTPTLDFSDATKTIKYKIDNIPEGSWLVYVILDDNNNWSSGQHLPDQGDLVGFIKGVNVAAGQTGNVDFPLTDRY